MDAVSEIEALVAFERRGAGTDAERRAAAHLARRLEQLGRDVSVEPTSVRPNWAVTHVLHAVAAVVGSVVSVDSPVAGAAILLAVAVSAFGDLTGLFHLARRITGRRASQNVVSGEDGGKPGALVLVAHVDAGRSGSVFARRSAVRRARLGRLLRRPFGLFEPFFWSIVVVLACTVLRLVGIDALALTIVQFVPTVVLIVSVPLLADIALSGFVPAANDNASGVATALRLAERHGGRLEHFDLWVVLTGAQEGVMLGMRDWLSRRRRELDRSRTVVVAIDEVGAGTVRYARKEGLVVAAAYHPAVLELCDEIAADHGAQPISLRSASDAHMARVRGYPAIAITCRDELGLAPHHHLPSDTPENVDPGALARAFDFCSELVELIDERIGPQLEAGEPEPAAS